MSYSHDTEAQSLQQLEHGSVEISQEAFRQATQDIPPGTFWGGNLIPLILDEDGEVWCLMCGENYADAYSIIAGQQLCDECEGTSTKLSDGRP